MADPVFTNVSKALQTIAGIKFNPGDTKPIPEVFAAKVMQSAMVRGGALVPGQAAMPPAAPDPVHVTPSIAGLELKKALALVKMCDSISVLEKWAKDETRADVLTAMHDRAKALKA